MTSTPFSAAPIELAAAGGVPARLLPLDQRSCASLAAGIVAMEPWSVMNYPADKLAAFLASPDASAARYVVSVKGAEAGVVSVRHPWLKGPYLELLALYTRGAEPRHRVEHHGLVRNRKSETSSAQSLGLRLVVQRTRLAILRTARLCPRGDAAGPRRRRLRRNSAAQISAWVVPVTRRSTRRSLPAAARPDRCRGCPSRRRRANDRQTTHRPRSRRSRRPSIRTHRHSRA